MIVAIVNNGSIEQTGEISVLFPNVSFPASGPSDEWMAENSLVPVTYFKAHDAATQKLVSCEAYVEGGDVYAVTVESLSADELAAKNESQWSSIRSMRNQKLSNCDWTQLADAPVDALKWAVYRQELRDITVQIDPFSITWPQEPE